MVFKKSFSLFIMSLLLLNSLPICPSTSASIAPEVGEQVQEEPTEEQLQEAKAFFEQQLSILREQLLVQLNEFDRICEHSASMIYASKDKSLDKQALQTYIATIRAGTHEMQQRLSFTLEPNELTLSIIISHELIKNFRIFIKSNLKKIIDIDLGIVMQRSNYTSFEALFEELYKLSNTNNRILPLLKKDVQNMGVNFFNRFMRSVIRFEHDYDIISRTAKVALYAGIASIFISKIDSDWFKLDKFTGKPKTQDAFDAEGKPVQKIIPSLMHTLGLSKLKAFIGDWPEYSRDGELINQQPRTGINPDGTYQTRDNPLFTTYSRIIKALCYNIPLLNADITPWVTFGTFAYLFKKDFLSIYEWYNKVKTNTLNALQGNHTKVTINLLGAFEPRYTFDDIIGNDHAKELLQQIVDYICHAEMLDAAGIAPQIGWIFAGEPRCGKSMAAEALAGEIKKQLLLLGRGDKFPFAALTPAQIYSQEIGGFANLMSVAQEKGPLLLFIDEADMLQWQRDRNPDRLAEALTAMSGVNARNDKQKVIIILATNKPENFDFAIPLHGRFGKTIRFEYPNTEQRQHYFKEQLDKRAMSLPEEFLHKLAVETEGCPFDTMNVIMTSALLNAKMRGSVISQEDFERAMDQEFHNILPNSNNETDTHNNIEKAIHLAGHTLMNMLLQPANPVIKVTLNKVTAKIQEQPIWTHFDTDAKQEPIEFGKVFTAYQANNKFRSYDDLITECKISLAGHVAEKIITGNCAYTYHNNDYSRARSIVRYIIFKGVRKDDLAKELREQKLKKVDALLEKCEQEVTQLLIDNKEKLQAITNGLVKHNTLTAHEIYQIINAQPTALEAAVVPA